MSVLIAQGPQAASIEAALSAPDALPIEAKVVAWPLPNTQTASAARARSQDTEAIARARQAYVGADFEGCLEALSDPSEDLTPLLRNDRATSARKLFWRIACWVGASEAERARRHALRFARLELAVPASADTVSPEVEALIADAMRSAARAKPSPVQITSKAPGRVFLDGRNSTCSTPCTVELSPGEHLVRVDIEGYLSAHRRVRGDAVSPVHFAPQRAPPRITAAQWHARYGLQDLESSGSLQLLASSVRARNLLVIHAQGQGARVRVIGALLIDGQISARGERADDDVQKSAIGLVEDLLVNAQLVAPPVPLYERPLFWVGIGAAAAVAATVTTLLLYRPSRTEVFFP